MHIHAQFLSDCIMYDFCVIMSIQFSTVTIVYVSEKLSVQELL